MVEKRLLSPPYTDPERLLRASDEGMTLQGAKLVSRRKFCRGGGRSLDDTFALLSRRMPPS